MMAGPIGALHAASIMEELKELGAERLWVLGYAGSLSPQFPLGALENLSRSLGGCCPLGANTFTRFEL